MDSRAVLIDAFGRVRDHVREVVDGLSVDDLRFRPDQAANPIAWLVWHLSRVQDAQLSDASGDPQVWLRGGFCERFGLPFDPAATGYGQSSEDAGTVSAEAELLLEYHEAVHDATVGYLRTVRDRDLDRVVDERFDPPVSLGVRLVSIVADDLQHAGQAAYVRGLLERSRA